MFCLYTWRNQTGTGLESPAQASSQFRKVNHTTAFFQKPMQGLQLVLQGTQEEGKPMLVHWLQSGRLGVEEAVSPHSRTPTKPDPSATRHQHWNSRGRLSSWSWVKACSPICLSMVMEVSAGLHGSSRLQKHSGKQKYFFIVKTHLP